jgi:S1-C subfamily serine protease
LLNARGEVIGINTQKLIKKNVTGIGFALSATDLLEVLHRFYPATVPLTEKLFTPTQTEETKLAEESFGTVVIKGPAGAEISVDRMPVGGTPARLKLSAARHLIVIKVRGRADWMRYITVLKDSEVTLDPDSQ